MDQNSFNEKEEGKLKYEDMIVFIVESYEEYQQTEITYQQLVEDALKILEVVAKFEDEDNTGTLWDFKVTDKDDPTDKAMAIEIFNLKKPMIKKDKENNKA